MFNLGLDHSGSQPFDCIIISIKCYELLFTHSVANNHTGLVCKRC